MHLYCDDRGRSLMSVFDHLAELPGQFNTSVMYAGVVKAWHRHARQDDHWVVLAGDLKIGLFNTEKAVLTAEIRLAGGAPGGEHVAAVEVPAGAGKAIYLGEHRPGLLWIPAGLWHGGVALGGRDALLLYYMTRKYDPQQPDEQREPWDKFPFSWAAEFK
jgi:dTDP-4-dehydrorhamnose 3,5-epimerase